MSVEGVEGICAATENGDLYCAKGTMSEKSAAILSRKHFEILLHAKI
jgi:hypothetical protein